MSHPVTGVTTPTYENFRHLPTVFSVRMTSVCPHGKRSNQCCGNAEWLQVIHAVNGALEEGTRQEHGFGAPVATYAWWTGGIWTEEYPEFRVLLRPDWTTNIVAKTEAAAERLKAAVRQVTGHEAVGA